MHGIIRDMELSKADQLLVKREDDFVQLQAYQTKWEIIAGEDTSLQNI